MRIKTKSESIATIKRLGLNQFQEAFFDGFDEDKVKAFLDTTQFEWYDVRDKMTAASPKTKAVRSEEVIEHCKRTNIEKFTVGISFRNYEKNHICVGEMNIHGDTIDYFLSNSVCSPRELLKNPDHSGVTDIFDKKLHYIKGLQEAIDYAFEHELFDVIIEFWVFNIPVGIKNEKVVIRELRSDY